MLALNSRAAGGCGAAVATSATAGMNHAQCRGGCLAFRAAIGDVPPSSVSAPPLPTAGQWRGAAGSAVLRQCSPRARARASFNAALELPFWSRARQATLAAAREKGRRWRMAALISSAERSEEQGEGITEEMVEVVEKVEDEEIDEDVEDVAKSILKLSLPGLGIVLSDPLMSLIDTACVGQISSIQLASLGPNTLIFNFVFNVFGFLGTTTCNFMATTNVKFTNPQERQRVQTKASRVLSQALCLAGIIGVVATVLMEGYGPQLLSLMGATSDYMGPALTYLHIRALSVPAVLMLLVGHGACLGRQDARTPLLINLVAAVLNFVGDFVLTLGLKWGVAGAAWATVASQYVAVVLLFIALTRKPEDHSADSWEHSKEGFQPRGRSILPPITLKLGWYGLPSQENLGEFYDMALSLVLRCILGMVIYTSVGKVAAAVGTLPLAAHQVAMQVFWFLSFFPESLSISAQSLIARDVKRNPKRARTVARLLVGLSMGFGVALAGIVFAIHTFGTSWLTADREVARLVMSVTKQSMICVVMCAVAVVIEGIAIASGDLAYLSRMQLLNLVGMLIATISTHRSGWGLPGVWWCMVLFFGTRMVYHAIHVLANWDTHVLGTAPMSLKLNAA